MIFGVNNDTLKVVGTDFYATRKKVGNEELESWLSTRLGPRIDFEIIDDLIMRTKDMSAYSRFLQPRISLFLSYMKNMSELALQQGS